MKEKMIIEKEGEKREDIIDKANKDIIINIANGYYITAIQSYINLLNQRTSISFSLIDKKYIGPEMEERFPYLRNDNERKIFEFFSKRGFGKEGGLINYIISKLPQEQKKEVTRLLNNYVYGPEGILALCEKNIKDIRKRRERAATILGSRLANGPYGHEEQIEWMCINIAFALALEGKEEELKQLYKFVKDETKSFNLRDIGLSSDNFYLTRNLLSRLLDKALFNENGRCRLTEIEIQALRNLRFGSFKDKDSELFLYNDKAHLVEDGYLSGNVVPGVKTPDDVLRELRKIIETGRVSSSFNAGLNYHEWVKNRGIGLFYEAIKLDYNGLILKQIIDQAPKYAEYPDVLRRFPQLALFFQYEAYRILISSVSSAEKNKDVAIKQMLRAKAIAEFFYHLLPLILEKAKTIVLNGRERESFEENKADYYKFMPEIIRKVFETLMDGNSRTEGVEKLGAVSVSWSEKIAEQLGVYPLNDYIKGKAQFPSKPAEIEALAEKMMKAIDGDCAVQQIKILSTQLIDKEDDTVDIIFDLKPNRMILNPTNIRVGPKEIEIKTTIFAGLPGSWSASSIDPKPQKIYNSIEDVPMNPKKLTLNYSLPVLYNDFNISVTAITDSQYLKPYKYHTTEIVIPGKEPTSISIPFFLTKEISSGGGIGGITAGFREQYGSKIADLVANAYSLQLTAESNPDNIFKANKLLYVAISEAYKLDPSSVGGDATKKWLDENKNAAENGIFKTPLPNELINSNFGSQISLFNVPKQLKLDEIRSVNVLDLGIGKYMGIPNLYIKGGWIRYDRKYSFLQFREFDSQGNPIFDRKIKETKDEVGIAGLGYHVNIKGKNKFNVELFGGRNDITFKILSQENKTLLEKLGSNIINEWNSSISGISKLIFVEFPNLFDEISVTKYNERWLIRARTNNLSIPLYVPLKKLTGLEVPAYLTWRSVFNIDPSFKTSLNKDFGDVLELGIKTQKYNISFYEYINGSPLQPKGLGAEVLIKTKKLDVGLGISLVPPPGRDSLDSKISNNVVSGHFGLRF